jgi:hypothetical protein
MDGKTVMTENEWLTWNDPQPMVEVLRGNVSHRKLRLFAVACCRRNWRLLDVEPCRKAVEITDRYVEGTADEQGLRDAHHAAFTAAHASTDESLFDAVNASDWHPDHIIRWFSSRSEDPGARADLLRDIFGSLLFRSVALDLSWLSLDNETIPKLAKTAYTERKVPSGTLDPLRLAILADALEDAGCADASILDHLRKPRAHVRGCWVVDLLLGKS